MTAIGRFRRRARYAALFAGGLGAGAARATTARAQADRPAACVARPGAPQPVIDVHMHAVGATTRAGSLADDTAALHDVITELDRDHVVAVVTSSLSLPRTLQWARRDARFIPTFAFRDTSASVDSVRALVRADLARRLMFGSDAAGPGALTSGIAGITSAAFLSAPERRDILCDNAARFYRLDAKARPPARIP